MEEMAKTMMIIGLVIAAVSLMILIVGKTGLGQLPGDFVWRRGNATFYFPMATSILVSLLLTFLINFFMRR